MLKTLNNFNESDKSPVSQQLVCTMINPRYLLVSVSSQQLVCTLKEDAAALPISRVQRLGDVGVFGESLGFRQPVGRRRQRALAQLGAADGREEPLPRVLDAGVEMSEFE